MGKDELEKQDLEKQEIEKLELEIQDLELEIQDLGLETQDLKSEKQEQKLENTKVKNEQVKKQVVSKIAVKKDYDIVELIKLSGKLIKNNKKKFWTYFLQLALFFALYFVLTLGIAFMSDVNMMESSSISNGIATLFNSVRIVFFVILVIISVLATSFIIWLTIKSVSAIDTGIDSIELKKANAPGASSFLKMLAVYSLIFLIATLITLLLAWLFTSLLAGESVLAVYLFLWIYIQMLIVIVLAIYYLIFATFEIVSKNKSISESLTNARINLFYSTNNVILKMIAGNVLISVIFMLGFMGVMILGAIIFTIPLMLELNFLTPVFSAIMVILVSVLYAFIYFLLMMYIYLTYMLNEIRDDKVGNLK